MTAITIMVTVRNQSILLLTTELGTAPINIQPPNPTGMYVR